jgi:hypothetical protein
VECALNPFSVARSTAAATLQVCRAGTWEYAVDDETPKGDSTARSVALETGWNRPDFITQQPMYH